MLCFLFIELIRKTSVAGPFCTQILSDLGADVIKVERPGSGDDARKFGPPFLENSTDSVYFMGVNRNKRSVCVDLKRGKDILYELARKSDILVENYVPGKLSEYALGYEDISQVNPSLIYCSITGYGSNGPYSRRPGYDVIAASVGGLLHITGSENGPPVKVGVAVTDIATGLYAHGAIMAALLQRTKTGKGQKIDVNLLSTQVAMLINIASNYLNANQEAKRWGTAHGSIVPYEAFKTKTGYLTVGAGNDQQFKHLCKLVDLPELAEDDRFLTNDKRVKHRNELVTILSEKIATSTSQEWMERFENASFPVGPINSIGEVFNDPHIKDIGLVKTLPHPTAGPVHVVGPPVAYSGSANEARTAPPLLGQHTDEVLREILNYDAQQIDELRQKKIIQ